jgi:WD40 repeat protein
MSGKGGTKQLSLFSFFGGGGSVRGGKRSESDTSSKGEPASSKKRAKANASKKGSNARGTKTAALTNSAKKRRIATIIEPSTDAGTLVGEDAHSTTTTPRKPSTAIENVADFSSFSFAKNEASLAGDDTPMSVATTRTTASTPPTSQSPSQDAAEKYVHDRAMQDSQAPSDDAPNETTNATDENNIAKSESNDKDKSDNDGDGSSSDSDSDSASAQGEYQLSEYELLRLRNIERNNRRLAELGLAGGWSSAMPSNTNQGQKAKKKSRKKVKGDTTKTRAPAMPTRKSSRTRRTVLEAAAEGEGWFGASNLLGGNDVPKYQEMAEIEEEPVEEVFTVSPMLEYAMNADNADDSSDSNHVVFDKWSANTQPNDIQCLKPIGKRLAPPNGLGAIYSLQFYPQEWCPEQRSDNQSWVVGAGKAGIISLWDCNWSSASSSAAEEDEMIDPVLSWKAHSGRWVADVRFILPSTSGSNGEITKSPPSRLLSAANDGSVALWDLSTVSSLNGSPKLLCRTGKELHRSGIFAMDVDINGQKETYVATGSKDKTVAVTALDAIARGNGFAEPFWVSDYHTAKVGAVAFCGKGTSLLASASDDGSIAVHDFRADGKKQVVAELIDAHCRPHSVSWDPLSENHLMTAGLDDVVKVFDIRSLDKPLFTYHGHVPTLSKYKRIHHPVFYNPCQRTTSSELFVLSGGESSAALSMFRNQDARDSAVPVYSRGRLPADCGDAGCLAIQGQRVASTVDGGEVLLLAPKLKKVE